MTVSAANSITQRLRQREAVSGLPREPGRRARTMPDARAPVRSVKEVLAIRRNGRTMCARSILLVNRVRSARELDRVDHRPHAPAVFATGLRSPRRDANAGES
jgi:hypothetical protein